MFVIQLVFRRNSKLADIISVAILEFKRRERATNAIFHNKRRKLASGVRSSRVYRVVRMSTTEECSLWWLIATGSESQVNSRGFIERCVTRKLWTRSRSQDAAAKYRSHYAPYYPRLHSAFEERLPDGASRGGGRGDRKFRKFHRENRFRLRGRCLPPSPHGTPQRARIGGGQVRLLAFWRLFVRNL